MGTGVGDPFDLSLDTSGAKATGYQDTVYIMEKLIYVFICDSFRIDPFDANGLVGRDTTVLKSFHYADVSVMKGNIFAYQGNCYFPIRMAEILYHMLPFAKIRFRTVKMEAFTGNLGQVFLFHGKGGLVKVFHI